MQTAVNDLLIFKATKHNFVWSPQNLHHEELVRDDTILTKLQCICSPLETLEQKYNTSCKLQCINTYTKF